MKLPQSPSIYLLGGGAWGCALYAALSVKAQTHIYSRRTLPTHNQVSWNQVIQAPNALFVISITSSHLRDFLCAHPLPRDSKILLATKGIEENSGALMSDIMDSFFASDCVGYLGGPSFAKEVAAGLPCAVVIHAHNPNLAATFAAFFPPFMRVYVSDDVVGGEIAGAYKNVIAIASGICEGLGLGQNARASLLARGLVEMERFGHFFGAKMETFLGLSGAGDLFLTSTSTLSRNFRVGLALAQGQAIDSIIANLGEVAEGIKTSRAILALGQKHNIYTPIALEVARVIDGKNAKDALYTLLHSGKDAGENDG
ncbi:MAG: NAD(P)H-dependent glycerol-3-phosphate dehydrogenase [Helicobacter sp.]|nr:NAD(P)H-dependent glycerol-3-phosphate dehydrogenase [Helicobacter sp.]